MLGLILISSAALQVPATAAPPPIAKPDAIVVAARRSLADCIAAACSPEDEVEAALYEATVAFRNGDYESALTTTRQAVSRNKRFAARMPIKLADLYATQSDIAKHGGFGDIFRNSAVSSVDVLRDHVGRTSPTTLAARVRIGDMLVSTNMPAAADGSYAQLAKDATANGQPRIAALAIFRRAWLAFDLEQYAVARRLLDDFAQQVGSNPDLAGIEKALRFRLAIKAKDEVGAERLLAGWRTDGRDDPVLLYQPKLTDVISDFRDLAGRPATSGEIQWVDIGFWVRPSGMSEEVEILRPERGTGWAGPIRKMIEKRRYAPFADGMASPGQYRIERYSLRREFGLATGSRMIGRYGEQQIIQVDLTAADRLPRKSAM